MDYITYIILLKNQSKNIPALAKSLKGIKGDFRKEYIVIDDASSDDTLDKAHKYLGAFGRCTILSNDEYHGPAYCANKAFSLAHGKFIHFVDGDEILDPESTITLLDACKTMGAAAATSLYGALGKDGNKFKSSYETGDIVIIDNPVKAILDNSVHDIRKFGHSGTLISSFLLEEMEGLDEHVFTFNMSGALAAGKLSKFAFVKKTLAFTSENADNRYDKKFLIHDDLKAIFHFMEDNPVFAAKYTAEIYKALWSVLWHLDKKHKVKSLPRYFLSRYKKNSLDIETLKELYEGYIAQLDS